MSDAKQARLRRVLIASANPLFARGLQKVVAQHWDDRSVEIRMAVTMPEVTAALETWQPDLVIVDYGDAGKPGNIQREAFLSHFIAGDQPMQVMLVSLSASGEVVVYNRRTLTSAEAENWLDVPWSASSHDLGPSGPASPNSTGPADSGPEAAAGPAPRI